MNMSKLNDGYASRLTVLRLKFHGLSGFTVSTLNLPFPFANDFIHSRFAVAFLPAAIFTRGPKFSLTSRAPRRVSERRRSGRRASAPVRLCVVWFPLPFGGERVRVRGGGLGQESRDLINPSHAHHQ